VTYAESRRKVTPAEQHIHSLLEVAPLMATASLTALHWRAAVSRRIGALSPREAFTAQPARGTGGECTDPDTSRP